MSLPLNNLTAVRASSVLTIHVLSSKVSGPKMIILVSIIMGLSLSAAVANNAAPLGILTPDGISGGKSCCFLVEYWSAFITARAEIEE